MTSLCIILKDGCGYLFGNEKGSGPPTCYVASGYSNNRNLLMSKLIHLKNGQFKQFLTRLQISIVSIFMPKYLSKGGFSRQLCVSLKGCDSTSIACKCQSHKSFRCRENPL